MEGKADNQKKDLNDPFEEIPLFRAVVERADPEELKKNLEIFERFQNGEISLGELMGRSEDDLLKIAEYGYLQFKRGNLADAEEAFSLLTAYDDRRPYFYAMLGCIKQRRGKYMDALVAYTAAIDLDPSYIAAYVYRGELLQSLGYVDQPLADFEKAIELDPLGKNPWANRGRLLEKVLRKRWEEHQNKTLE